MNYAEIYNEDYFTHYTTDNISYATFTPIRELMNSVVQVLISITKPSKMLDVGCAFGYSVDAARAYGVHAWGIDVSEYAIEHSPVKEYLHWHDVTEPFEMYDGVDLLLCIEVLEHLTEEDGLTALDNICAVHPRYIYFSSSPDDLDEPTHINVHPEEYWIEQFSQRGYIKYQYLKHNPISWAHLFLNKKVIKIK